MADTNIEWATKVWNPMRGCTRVSEGCRNCYAERQAIRQSAPGQPYHGLVKSTPSGPRWTGQVATDKDKLMEPLKWRKPERIFVNSMSDLFHEGVPNQFIVDVFGVMLLAHWHTFLVLTKRPDRMRDFLAAGDHGIRHQFLKLQLHGGTSTREVFRALDVKRRDNVEWDWPLPNVHLGVSVENQQTADERIPLLLQTPAAIRWVSYEPALGPVDFDAPHCQHCSLDREHIVPPSDGANAWCVECDSEACYGWWLDRDPGLDWIVVGGESGPGARPFDVAWARSTVRECHAAGVACFVKQIGANPVVTDDTCSLERAIREGGYTLRDRKGGDPAEWAEDLRVRAFPEARP